MAKRRIKIPTKFKLFNSTFYVKYDTQRLNDTGNLGEADPCQYKIYLSKTYGGVSLPIDAIIDTFYHEKVHTILDSMGEYELSQNEKFVEIFGKLLRQSDETAEYK